MSSGPGILDMILTVGSMTPTFLVHVAAMIWAGVTHSQHPVRSTRVLIGAGILLAAQIISLVVYWIVLPRIMDQLMNSAASIESLTPVYSGVALVMSLFQAAGIGLLVWAALGREPSPDLAQRFD